MICKKCGAKNEDDFKFCCQCGYELDKDQNNELHSVTNSTPKRESDSIVPFWRKIPGFRSKTPWKMILALIVYSWIFAIIVIPFIPKKQPVSVQKETVVDIYRMADTSYDNKYYDRAKELYNKIIQEYPDSHEAKQAQEKLSSIDDLIKQEQAAKLQEEKRKAEEAEIKRKAYEESIKPPLELVEADVTLNVISHPQVSVIVKNISNKTVDAYTVGIYCYDRFGNEVKHYAYGTNRYGGLCQRTISPGNSTGSNYYWTLHGHENTAKIDVVLEKVHFTDDTSWIPQSSQRVSAKGVLEQ